MAEPFGLTPQDFKEFKELAVQEFGDTIADGEFRDMAVRLISLYSVLCDKSKEGSGARISKVDAMVFAYISTMLREYNHSPTVRELSRFLGRGSSRTGQRALDRLIVEGLVERGRDRRLRLGDKADWASTFSGRKGNVNLQAVEA